MRQSLWQSLVWCFCCPEEYTYFYGSTVDTVLPSVYGGFGEFTQIFWAKATSDCEVDTLSVLNVHVHALWATRPPTCAGDTEHRFVFWGALHTGAGPWWLCPPSIGCIRTVDGQTPTQFKHTSEPQQYHRTTTNNNNNTTRTTSQQDEAPYRPKGTEDGQLALFNLFEEEPSGVRPEAFAEPGPQERLQRHTLEQLAEPESQVVDQLGKDAGVRGREHERLSAKMTLSAAFDHSDQKVLAGTNKVPR